MSQWDRIESTIRRTQDLFGFEEAQVFAYTETYDPATGDTEVTRTEIGESPVRVEFANPDHMIGVDASGTESEVDYLCYVPDDLTHEWTSYGDDGQADEIEADGRTYRVQDDYPEHNGLTVLPVIEL